VNQKQDFIQSLFLSVYRYNIDKLTEQFWGNIKNNGHSLKYLHVSYLFNCLEVFLRIFFYEFSDGLIVQVYCIFQEVYFHIPLEQISNLWSFFAILPDIQHIFACETTPPKKPRI